MKAKAPTQAAEKPMNRKRFRPMKSLSSVAAPA
jgi:hypothetical protein